MSTSPDGCVQHSPARTETFEEELTRALTSSLREGAVQVSGMFGVDATPES